MPEAGRPAASVPEISPTPAKEPFPMTITDIIEHSQSRYKIYIDNTFAFLLYKKDLRLYHIEKDAPLTESSYHQITQELLPKRARLRCMHLLQNMRYTEKQLYDKLCRSFYPHDIARAAIDYVRSYGYVDDKQYAQDYISAHISSRSKTHILNTLSQKGIPIDVSTEIWKNTATEAQEQIEKIQIENWLKKKNYDKNTANYQEKRRMSAFLYRKGFQIETIMRVLLLDIP